MNKKYFLGFYLFFLLRAATLFATENNALNFSVKPALQQTIPSNHWIYDAMTTMAMETRETNFAFYGPVSIGEIRRYLREISHDRLSETGRYLYGQILEYLNEPYFGFNSDLISAGVNPVIQPEFYFKTNPKVDWIYGEHERAYPLQLPIFINVADFVTLESNIFIGKYQLASDLHRSRTNIPLGLHELNGNFPLRSLLSAGAQGKNGSFMNFQIGIGEMNIGRTQTGSIILSDYMRGASYAQLSFFSPRIKYTATITQLEVNKNMYLHRFDFRPAKNLSIGVFEGVLVNAPLELRFLNPIMIYHGLGSWQNYGYYNTASGSKSPFSPEDSRSSAYLGITADYIPWKNSRIYLLFAMNQLTFGAETASDASKIFTPNGMAIQTGVENRIPFKSGYFTADLEAVYTTPYMYIAAAPFWSFYRDRREFYNDYNPPYKYTPIRTWAGTPFGPDAIAAQICFGYEKIANWKVELTYRFKVKGEINKSIFDKWLAQYEKDPSKLPPSYFPGTIEDAKKRAPTGVPEYENLITLRTTTDITEYFTLGVQFGYVLCLNFNNTPKQTEYSFEAAVSAKIKIIPRLFK